MVLFLIFLFFIFMFVSPVQFIWLNLILPNGFVSPMQFIWRNLTLPTKFVSPAACSQLRGNRSVCQCHRQSLQFAILTRTCVTRDVLAILVIMDDGIIAGKRDLLSYTAAVEHIIKLH